MALKLGTQTNQILKDGDEVWIPSISSILLAVPKGKKHHANQIFSPINKKTRYHIGCQFSIFKARFFIVLGVTKFNYEVVSCIKSIFLPQWWVEFNDELSCLFINRFRYMKVKKMGITEILRRILLFSADKIKKLWIY